MLEPYRYPDDFVTEALELHGDKPQLAKLLAANSVAAGFFLKPAADEIITAEEILQGLSGPVAQEQLEARARDSVRRRELFARWQTIGRSWLPGIDPRFFD